MVEVAEKVKMVDKVEYVYMADLIGEEEMVEKVERVETVETLRALRWLRMWRQW
jgi:hypothetical protein